MIQEDANMDERFAVHAPPRPDTTDHLADLPLITLAWRAMRKDSSQRRQEQEDLKVGLLRIADEIRRIRSSFRTMAARSDPDTIPARKLLEDTANSLQRGLERLGMTIVSPEGEPYTPEQMQLFDNIAQVERIGITGPLINEVMQPAIFYRGSLWQMGKAVIALPMNIQRLNL
jgi:hypothetical protein